MRRALLLIVVVTLLAAIVGWSVGAAYADPSPTRTPPSSLLSAWTLAMFAFAPIAAIAILLAPRDPQRSFFAAFFATFGASIALGLATPAAAYAPEDFAPLTNIDWLATVGRGIAGAASFGVLAGAIAYVTSHALMRRAPAQVEAPAAEAPPIAPPPPPAPPPLVPSRLDEEALAIAKRRLAMGELTRHDYDELLRRLRE